MINEMTSKYAFACRDVSSGIVMSVEVCASVIPGIEMIVVNMMIIVNAGDVIVVFIVNEPLPFLLSHLGNYRE